MFLYFLEFFATGHINCFTHPAVQKPRVHLKDYTVWGTGEGGYWGGLNLNSIKKAYLINALRKS